MTNTKKRTLVISAVCILVLLAFGLTVYAWATNFDEDWVIGKSKEAIEQRYGAADIYKNDYIEYWYRNLRVKQQRWLRRRRSLPQKNLPEQNVCNREDSSEA